LVFFYYHLENFFVKKLIEQALAVLDSVSGELG